jgi:hypothetical protein
MPDDFQKRFDKFSQTAQKPPSGGADRLRYFRIHLSTAFAGMIIAGIIIPLTKHLVEIYAQYQDLDKWLVIGIVDAAIAIPLLIIAEMLARKRDR